MVKIPGKQRKFLMPGKAEPGKPQNGHEAGMKICEARVRKSTGSMYEVISKSGERMQCRTRGKLRLNASEHTNPVAVGDWVKVARGDYEEGHRILEILPRQNALIRKANKSSRRGQVMAANVDVAVLVASLVAPKTSQGFIDRFLVASEAHGIPAIIVFNKYDLYKGEAKARYALLHDLYTKLNYVCVTTAALQGEGMHTFGRAIAGKLVILCGHSGVGKSTILNQLSPGLNLRTNAVSTAHLKGRHTTTHAEMHRLQDGTCIIDTPGIRDYGLLDYRSEEIGPFMPEFHALLGQCRFNNCTHTHEPGCAIIEAVEHGDIHPLRYNSYLSMLENQDQYQ